MSDNNEKININEYASEIYDKEHTDDNINRLYDCLKAHLVGDLQDFIEFEVVTVLSDLIEEQAKIELQQHIWFPELQHYIWHFGTLGFAEFGAGDDVSIEKSVLETVRLVRVYRHAVRFYHSLDNERKLLLVRLNQDIRFHTLVPEEGEYVEVYKGSSFELACQLAMLNLVVIKRVEATKDQYFVKVFDLEGWSALIGFAERANAFLHHPNKQSPYFTT